MAADDSRHKKRRACVFVDDEVSVSEAPKKARGSAPPSSSGSRHRDFCFTAYDSQATDALLRSSCVRAAVWRPEVCPETGRKHIQVCLYPPS